MELKEVFEPVLNFIRNFQKKDKEITSKQAAKDRLKLVLMQDRASVSPDFFEMMKKEIIDVIKKYIEIDEESLEVELTRGMEAGLEGPALYANIPIKNVKPVAPKNDEDQNEVVEEMTEEKADAVAEQLLNQAEEILNKVNFEEGSNKEEQEQNSVENLADSSAVEENVKADKVEKMNEDTKIDTSDVKKASEEKETKKESTKASPKRKTTNKSTVKKTNSKAKK